MAFSKFISTSDAMSQGGMWSTCWVQQWLAEWWLMFADFSIRSLALD